MRKPRPQFLLLAALFAAAPVGADWLVTRDGGRIESKGPWKVQGRQIVFTQPNGTLASLRTDQVDLDQSAVETQRAREATVAVPAPTAKPEPVMRLTDKDLPQVKAAEDEAAPAAAKAGTQVSSGLEVANWERADIPAGDGVELFGTVKNSGKSSVTSPTLIVSLYDSEGRLLATAEGKVNAAALPPAQTASFRAVFPGVDDFSAARFDAQGTPFVTRAGAAEGAEGEATEAAPVEGDEAPVDDEPVAPETDGGTYPSAPASPPPTS